jgi:hypothetical protein
VSDDEFSDKELTVAGEQLPAARTVVAVLRENLHQLVLDARNARGAVRMPEDTYALVRSLMGVREGAADYAHAFATIRSEADGFIQDDLELAVGEQDGVPNSGMKVPDIDGTDIAISVDSQNQYGFDTTALVKALVFEALDQADEIESPDLARDYVAWLLDTALNRLIGLGQFRPQVTKVRAFADDLSRRDGGPAIASTVMATVTKTAKFKGIKVERRQPK